MSGSLRDPKVDPFSDENAMRRLLQAEKNAPPPPLEMQLRLARRMTASLAEGAPRWTPSSRFLVPGAVAAMLGLAYWGYATRTSVAVTPVVSPSSLPPPASIVEPPPHEEAPARHDEPPTAVPIASMPVITVHRVDTLAAEQKLVEAAREALAHGEPRLAYQALEAHAHRFARGQLREERESLSIRALITQGRAAEARRRAEAFLSRDSDSVFAPVVRVLLQRAKAVEPHGRETELP